MRHGCMGIWKTVKARGCHPSAQYHIVPPTAAEPMTIDDALYEMELVGHDFFLFHDKESDKPSVVYRRHAFDYGLIRLT